MKLIFLSVILLSTSIFQIFSMQTKTKVATPTHGTEKTSTGTLLRPLPFRPMPEVSVSESLASEENAIKGIDVSTILAQETKTTTTTVVPSKTEAVTTTTILTPLAPVEPVKPPVVTPNGPVEKKDDVPVQHKTQTVTTTTQTQQQIPPAAPTVILTSTLVVPVEANVITAPPSTNQTITTPPSTPPPTPSTSPSAPISPIAVPTVSPSKTPIPAPLVSAPRPAATVSPMPRPTPTTEKKLVAPPATPLTQEPVAKASTTPISPKLAEEKKAVVKKEPGKPQKPEKKESAVQQAETVQTKTVQPKKEETLDTIDIDEGGNWLIKRQIFEDTFKLMDQMDQVNIKIRDMRMTFYKSRNDIDKQVALFIKDIGFSLGKLDQMATMVLNDMEQERKREGSLSDEERSIVASLENVEEEIKQIQDAIQEIMSLDNKIDAEILKSLEDRINESASYRQQGWKNLQSIKQILSDEKAQNLYNKTKALYETMQNVLSWLQTKLLPYFNQTIQTIKNDMNTIKSKLDALQSKGINLQQEVAKIESKEEAADQERIKEEIEDADKEETEKIESDAQKQGFLGQSEQLIQNAFSWIASFFTSNNQLPQGKEPLAKKIETESVSSKSTGTLIRNL